MNKLIVSSSPHIREGITTRRIMLDVIIALVPAIIASVIIFGAKAFLLVCVSVASCVSSEYSSRKVMKRDNTILDLSAVVTGILLALNMPVSVNPIIVAFGGVIAIVVVKQMFGGIGQNFVNPAIAARIILMNSFPSKMTSWTPAFSYLGNVDTLTTATPLALTKTPELMPSYTELFLGLYGGCIGETCSVALLIGGVYLLMRKVITPTIPLVYLGTAAAFSLVLGRNPLIELLSGGILLAAIFMATDYVTCPITNNGRIIFAAGCGIITILIRVFGSLPEGASYAVMLMNIMVPLIEKITIPRPFGKERKK